MKVHFSYFRILLTLLIILAVALPASAAKDEFDRSDGALGGNWSSHSDMVIKSGRLHNQSSTTGWNSFLSVYNVVNANEATIYWPASGSGSVASTRLSCTTTCAPWWRSTSRRAKTISSSEAPMATTL